MKHPAPGRQSAIPEILINAPSGAVINRMEGFSPNDPLSTVA